MQAQAHFDVIIIGGSYAGLSAAMALGRSLRKVLILDTGRPCNRQTPHSHNFLTQDGEKPAEIARKARAQVLAYDTVRLLEDKAISGSKTEEGFAIGTESGQTFEAKKLIFATGIRDIMPDIIGFAESWGISVIHCPYCHGYEYRGQKTGIMATGDKAVHLASLVNNLTDKLSILTQGKGEFTQEQSAKLAKHKIEVIETEIAEVVHQNGYMQQLRFVDGSTRDFTAIYAALPFVQHSEIPVQLGCALTEAGHLQVDPFQKTTVEGVYACGDNASGMRSVANAVASGNMAGAMVNMVLVELI